MTPDDIARLMARAYQWQTPWSAAAVAETLAQPHSHLWSTPQAVLIMQIIAGEAEILALATDPEAQRQGVARRLLTQAQTDLQAKGVTRILLEVAAPNAPARALYTALGYEQVGHRRGYYPQTEGPAADAIVMARDLP